MQSEELYSVVSKINFQKKPKQNGLLYVLMSFGLLVFLLGLFFAPSLAWQGLLVNTLYFSGIALGGLMFSVIATVTDAFWLRPFKRLGEAMSSFGLFAVIFFVLLYFGMPYLFAWLNPDFVMHTKEAWLNRPFFIIRQLVAFLLLGTLVVIYLRNSILPDLALLKRHNLGFQNSFFQRFLPRSYDEEALHEHSYKSNKYLSPWLGFAFGLFASFIAFDWMMSIDQSWFSTMFGVQYVVASLVAAGAFLILMSSIANLRWGLSDYFTIFRHHDMSKLTFALTLLWTYMVFSQVLVIWYANMPEETPYLILRMKSVEWGWMFWLLFFMIFIFTFFGLMSRTVCRSPIFSGLFALNLLCGMWLEKFFLVVPSVQENQLAHTVDLGGANAALGWNWLGFFIGVSIALGMLSLFLVVFFRFLRLVPAVPVADHRFFKPHH